MTVVELRRAEARDVDAIAGLEESTFGADAWSASSVAQELAAPGRASVVAVDDGGLQGYAVTWRAGGVADLQRVVVAPRARRRGLGSRLVRQLLREAARAGADRALLEVSADNAAALACYRRLGFREIDRRPAYYRDGSDALVLQVRLQPATEEAP